MQSIYRLSARLNARELNQTFLAGLKATFHNKEIEKEIEMVVQAVDEMAYLLQSEANCDRLLSAKANIVEGKRLVEVDLRELA